MDSGRLCRWAATAALGAALALGAAACGTPRRQPAPQTGTPPPAALGTLQADATGIIDSAAARDWGQVSAQLSAIHSAWGSLRPDLSARGARTGLLDSTSQAISALDHQSNLLSARGTARAANRLTAFVPDMLALYSSPVPPQLAEMEYLARATQFDADAGQAAAVWEDARALGTQWAYIRPAAQRVDPGDSSRLDLQLAELDAAVADQGTAVPALAALTPATSSSGSSSSAAGPSASTPPAGSTATSSSQRAAAPSAASSGTPSLPVGRRRTGTMAGSGPASPAHTSGPVQSAAQSVLATLTAIGQAFSSGGGA